MRWCVAKCLVIGAAAAAALCGCSSEQVDRLLDAAAETPDLPVASIPAVPPDAAQRGRDEAGGTRTASLPQADPIGGSAPAGRRPHLRMAAFNIQVFGETKAGKPHVMRHLSQICRQFDLIAVQEIRSKNVDVCGQLVRRMNADGRRYGYLLSERIGRTVSMEQYAYIYDTARVRPVRGSVYVLPDPHEDFHREPFVARFVTADPGTGRSPFSFTLVNIHTDPDEADIWELDRLDDVLEAIQRDGSGEDDVILLGDFNADDRSLGELGAMRHVVAAIRQEPTNTRGTAMYDNIVFDRTRTTEFTGLAGVYNFESEFGLTRREALEISDHLPVWADFYVGEATGSMMAGP